MRARPCLHCLRGRGRDRRANHLGTRLEGARSSGDVFSFHWMTNARAADLEGMPTAEGATWKSKSTVQMPGGGLPGYTQRLQKLKLVPAASSKLKKCPRNGSPSYNRANVRRLCNSGKVNKASPQRYYQYALLDPLDQPFASFRWLFRSMGTYCDGHAQLLKRH